jgi:hypothetical protein
MDTIVANRGQKAEDHTTYLMQISRFLQNVGRWSYITRKNHAFLIARGQTIPKKPVLWLPWQPIYFTQGNRKVKLACEKWPKSWKNCWKLKRRKISSPIVDVRVSRCAWVQYLYWDETTQQQKKGKNKRRTKITTSEGKTPCIYIYPKYIYAIESSWLSITRGQNEVRTRRTKEERKKENRSQWQGHIERKE